MIYDNILQAIGHTPMIRLNRMNKPGNAEILMKFEALNVGGSIKTRTAYEMIHQAEKEGLIKEDTIIVEPTSGNQGIGLALVGAVRGYRTIIIMPDSVSEERRKLVRHYGAEVMLIHDAGDIGACIDECLQKALRMAEKDPNVFVPQQFANKNNLLAHKNHTALEIMEQVAGPVHGFCSGIGTGGTITGIGEVLKAQYPDIEIWAVEPENAAILAGGTIGILPRDIIPHRCLENKKVSQLFPFGGIIKVGFYESIDRMNGYCLIRGGKKNGHISYDTDLSAIFNGTTACCHTCQQDPQYGCLHLWSDHRSSCMCDSRTMVSHGRRDNYL